MQTLWRKCDWSIFNRDVVAQQDEFYMDDEMIAESIRRHSSFNIIHRESMFKVDVFIPRPRPFLQSLLSRARKQTLAATPTRREDTNPLVSTCGL